MEEALRSQFRPFAVLAGTSALSSADYLTSEDKVEFMLYLYFKVRYVIAPVILQIINTHGIIDIVKTQLFLLTAYA